MVVELWLKSSITGEYVSMDLIGDVSISVNKSFEEIEDFTTRQSSFTKTFNLPQTSKNSQFFQSAFMVNASTFVDSVVVDAVVKYGGADVFNGQCRLARITNSVNGGTYEIFLTQSLPDFTTTLQNIKLIDLDYSGITHTLDYDNVVSTWSFTGGSYNDYAGIAGKLLYPLAQYGYDSNLYYGTFEDNATGFTSSSYPLVLNQFAPWVNVKYLIDQIFQRSGFSYDSDFFETEYFKGLFALAKTNQTQGVSTTSGSSDNSNIFIATTNTGFFDYSLTPNYGTGYTEYFFLNIENTDPLNIFTPSLNVSNREHFFTAVVSGVYKFRVNLSLFTQNSSFPLYLNVALKDLDDGTIYEQVQGLLIQPSTNLTTFTLYFNATIPAASRVGLFYSRNQGGGFPDAELGVFRTTLSLYESPSLGGTDNVYLGDNLPGEITCLDFFKGIIQLFNLVLIPRGDRNFIIEKWDTYFEAGRVLDWSQKIDLGSSYSLQPTNTLQQEYIISYNTGEDRFSKINRQDRNQEYGTFRFVSNIPYHDGVKEVVIPFQPLPVATFDVVSDSGMIIPHLYTWNAGADTLENQYTPLGSGIRIGFYNGLQNFTITGTTKTWYLLSGSTAVGHTTYPAISHLSNYEYLPSTFSDLNIGNQYDYWQIPNDSFVGFTNQDVWNNFWAPRVQPLYDPEVKILSGVFKLTPTDINNLQFNDRVYFLESYWRLLSMTDADITETSLVECEWIKLPYYPVETPLIPPTYSPSIPVSPPTPTGSTFSHNVYTGNNTLDICAEISTIILVYSNCSTLVSGCSVFSDTGATTPIPEGTNIKPIGGTTIYQVAELGILQTLQNC
jgi:hypothetical protein